MPPRRIYEVVFLATTVMLSSGCAFTVGLWDWALAPPAIRKSALAIDQNGADQIVVSGDEHNHIVRIPRDWYKREMRPIDGAPEYMELSPPLNLVPIVKRNWEGFPWWIKRAGKKELTAKGRPDRSPESKSLLENEPLSPNDKIRKPTALPAQESATKMLAARTLKQRATNYRIFCGGIRESRYIREIYSWAPNKQRWVRIATIEVPNRKIREGGKVLAAIVLTPLTVVLDVFTIPFQFWFIQTQKWR